jgi:predicted dehydrogenase
MQRRQFLSNSLAASAAGVTFSALNTTAFAAANDKPKRVALIGCGWYGKSDLFRLLQVSPVEVVSLCDVDKNMLADCAEQVASKQVSKKKPRTYGDYRELLKAKDVDIVLVDTPDHWHALPAIAAMEMGADVWVQKPISVDIAEGKAMLDTARKHNRVVQVGTQRRSTPHLIDCRDQIIKEGKLGKIALVEIYCYYHMRAKENPPDSSPPDHLDYEMWTGPAPMRPYNSLVHPRRWRAFKEYGNGIVGDMCIHMLDMVRWMLDLGWPKRIDSTGGILVDKASKANISDTQSATFDYGDLQVNWIHRSWGAAPDPKNQWGATFYGDKGTLKANVNWYEFTPTGGGQPIHQDVKMELEEFPEDKTEKELEKHVAPAIRGHMKDFLSCIESRKRPVADIEQGHISTTACILANLSMQLGRSLTWDPAAHRIVNDDAANKLLKRPYRAPWKHPADA